MVPWQIGPLDGHFPAERAIGWLPRRGVADTLKGYEIQGWFALLAPSKTPVALIRDYNAALNAVVNDPAFVARLGELGAEARTGTPAAANDYMRQEVAHWGEMIRSANISLD